MLTLVIWVVSTEVFVKLALYICVSIVFCQVKKLYKHLVAICSIDKYLLSIHHMQVTKSCTYCLFIMCQAKYQVTYMYYVTKYIGINTFSKGEMLILLSFN